MTEDKTRFYLELHGHVPWTVTIADALEKGIPWETPDIVKQLRRAQDKIDELTIQLKDKNT